MDYESVGVLTQKKTWLCAKNTTPALYEFVHKYKENPLWVQNDNLKIWQPLANTESPSSQLVILNINSWILNFNPYISSTKK